MDQTVKEAKEKMQKSIDTFASEIAKVRTGKATTALLDGVKVEYYGNLTPLSKMANVSVLDAHTLSVTPWDKGVTSAIEKAILAADLGLNPRSDGTNIKVPIPPLTEERRKEMVKLVKKFSEDCKIAIRNVRRDANEHIKKKEKEKKITEDERKKLEDEVQKITNDFIKKVDDMVANKEKEIMKV
jgi:ribosome recycling factor